MTQTEATCDRCGKQIQPNTHTTDFWALITIWDEHGEVAKTGEQPDEIDTDYLVICQECSPAATKAWANFVQALKNRS